MVDSSSWSSHKLGDLAALLNETHSQQKYLFIHDKQGSVATFFHYKRVVYNMAQTAVKQQMELATSVDTLEELRRKIVLAMKMGSTLGINCEKMEVQFCQWGSNPLCPLNKLFDWDEGRKHETYFNVVKPEERDGNGNFDMNSKFMLVVISTAASPESMIETLPNSSKWRKVVIEAN